MTSLNSSRTTWMSGGVCLGKSSRSSLLFTSRIETKKLGSFRKALLNCMAENVLSVVFERSAVTMHAILPSRIFREFVAGNGKAWTRSKNSMPRTILKSSIGTIEKSSFPLHAPRVTCTPCAVPAMGLAGEFTAFIVPLSFVPFRPRRLASSSEMKLCVASVSSNARTAWPLTVVLIYLSHFFVAVGGWFLRALRRLKEPTLAWGSSGVDRESPLS